MGSVHRCINIPMNIADLVALCPLIRPLASPQCNRIGTLAGAGLTR
jgi:hypothetical protein